MTYENELYRYSILQNSSMIFRYRSFAMKEKRKCCEMSVETNLCKRRLDNLFRQRENQIEFHRFPVVQQMDYLSNQMLIQ